MINSEYEIVRILESADREMKKKIERYFCEAKLVLLEEIKSLGFAGDSLEFVQRCQSRSIFLFLFKKYHRGSSVEAANFLIELDSKARSL